MWLHEQIARQIVASSDRLAIDAGRRGQVTYRSLGSAISRVADQVSGRHAVGILFDRCPSAYAAILGCFHAGVPFVPLNPKFPLARLRMIAGLSGIDLVLNDEEYCELARDLEVAARPVGAGLFDDEDAPPSALVPSEATPESRAYHLFTSGSTGHPKGVPVRYGALDHYVQAISALLDYPAMARCSQTFDLCFDLALHDIFVTLTNGGTIVPASELDLLVPHRYIDRKRIDVWFSVPVLALVAGRGLGTGIPDRRLKLALFCGERLPLDYVAGFRPLMEPAAPLWNLYGPTEATIAITAQRVDETEAALPVASLGSALGQNRIGVFGAEGQVNELAEEVVEGELLLGGSQVFEGYDPAGPDPFVFANGDVWYRSGDLVRWQDGKLCHLGRTDQQVKLRGNRIELIEVEDAFRETFRAHGAVAVIRGADEAAEIVVAYTADHEVTDIAPLAAILPEYMWPGATMRLDRFPLNSNGKIDRRAIGELAWPKRG